MAGDELWWWVVLACLEQNATSWGTQTTESVSVLEAQVQVQCASVGEIVLFPEYLTWLWCVCLSSGVESSSPCQWVITWATEGVSEPQRLRGEACLLASSGTGEKGTAGLQFM